MKKRMIAFVMIAAVVICQAFFLMPEISYAEAAGETLVVRVQYAGEREEKILEKAKFSRAQLLSMGASTQRYSNVTDVGTVLLVIGQGPKLTTVIERAGIDMNSIKYMTFRTEDGSGEHRRYTRNYTVGKHLSGGRYYYPNLSKNYESEDRKTIIPLDGSLRGGTPVPSILALQCDSSKNPDAELSQSDMRREETFRFCLGQTELQENVKTRPGYGGGDVTSVDSAQNIFGLDITLYGSPVTGISLNLDNKNLKVGSKKKISAVIEGDELFKDEWGFKAEDLKWSSSDSTIAEVDQSGVIAIKKEGTVTITAKAPNGMTGSVTINATGKEEKDNGAAAAAKKPKGSKKPKDGKKKKEKAAGIVVKEVKIGGKLDQDAGQVEDNRQQMASDAEALNKAEESDPQVVFLSAFTSLIIFSFGILFRIRRYFREV